MRARVGDRVRVLSDGREGVIEEIRSRVIFVRLPVAGLPFTRLEPMTRAELVVIDRKDVEEALL